MPAWRVETADAFRGALREALAADSPAIVEVVSDINKDYPPYKFHQPRSCPDGQRPHRRAAAPRLRADDAWLAKRPKEPILEPDLPIVDPHHHLWDHANHRYLLDELVADTGTGHNITATVYIDCRSMYRVTGRRR